MRSSGCASEAHALLRRSVHPAKLAAASRSCSPARSARYEIAVENPAGVSRGVARAELDGVPLAGNEVRVPLADDARVHRLEIWLG